MFLPYFAGVLTFLKDLCEFSCGRLNGCYAGHVMNETLNEKISALIAKNGSRQEAIRATKEAIQKNRDEIWKLEQKAAELSETLYDLTH